MGLSIHFKGSFRRDASLSDMIAEVKDVALVHNWKYHIFESEFDANYFGEESYNENIYGITFSPPGCEPIDITFLSNGKMCSPLSLELFKDNMDKENYLFTISSKTQFAGFEFHKIIIDLFRYLSAKYFQEFELTDESCYWESGDENIMRQNFKKYSDMMDNFASGLENIPVEENESIEAYIVRVAKSLKFKRE